MRTVFKYTGILVLLVSCILFVVVNFSSADYKYKCDGKISLKGASTEQTIYIELGQYRPWAGLWSDSDGHLRFEIPNKLLGFYGHIIDVGSQLQLYDLREEFQGSFSTLSKTLSLNTRDGFFDGDCVAVE